MKTIFKLAFVVFVMSINAQQGVSSGSLSMVRSNGFESRNATGFLPERMIIVEDFMNYHKHQIGFPKHRKTQLTIDFDNQELKKDNQYLIQVGLATQEILDLESKNKVNVTLVIDRSGSMQSENKLEKVKNALIKFVEGLTEGDYLSIVAFDNQAATILNAQAIQKDKTLIINTIKNIYSGGSTNIDGGLQLGYQETMKNHSKDINSKVILLTDGMTNCGETNLEKIIQKSKVFNEKGIDISTIGVGKSLDFDLLKKLAEAGRGSNHFIGENEEDIQKVFIDELQSLVYQIGKNPEIVIELPKNYKIINSFGYQPNYENNTIKYKIENLAYGITQIFLLKVEKTSSENGEIKARLSYEKNSKKIMETENRKHQSNQSFTQKEVKKNYQIAMMAECLKNSSSEYANSNFGNAKKIVSETLAYITLNSDINDKDINRVYSILKKYDPVSFKYVVN